MSPSRSMGSIARALGHGSAALAVAISAGCASAPPVDDAYVPPSLELGTGTSRFEPVEDGAGVEMIHGAQGGWHVWLSVRTSGLDAQTGSLAIEVQPADESQAAQTTTLGIHLDPPDADGRRSYLGWPAILSDPSCTAGTLLRVRATLRTGSGEELSAERYLVPTAGVSPPPPCGVTVD